jgi:hypothetical protein
VFGVGDDQRVGQRVRRFVLVLDFEEDAEVGEAGSRRRLADQVGGVLVVVGIEEAREDDVVLQLAQLHRLALDDVLGAARPATGAERNRDGGESQGGEQRQGAVGSATRHRRRESIGPAPRRKYR